MRTVSLRQAVQENRQRQKYRRVLTELRSRVFDYQDLGAAAVQRYERVLHRVRRRLDKLRKAVTR